MKKSVENLKFFKDLVEKTNNQAVDNIIPEL